MKTLNAIQAISRIGKILSKIIYVFTSHSKRSGPAAAPFVLHVCSVVFLFPVYGKG